MNTKTKKVSLSDFSGGVKGDIAPRLLPLNYAVDCYNFNTYNGALTDGVGLNYLTFPDKKTLQLEVEVEAIYFYKNYKNGFSDKILFYCKDKYVYCYDLYSAELKKIETLYFETKPQGIYYRYLEQDIFIFSTEKEGVFSFDGERAEFVENMPNVVDTCIHNERMFAVSTGEKTRLYFSDDFNPFNFNVSSQEGGFIDFADERGGINKLVSSLGYLYLFRTHGISRVSSFYSQENFNVSHVFSCVGKIYANSITSCESGILFLASDGIYMISGDSVKKILSNLDRFFIGVDNTDSKAIYYNGKFYLKCKAKIKDKTEEVLVVYGVRDNYGYISKNLRIRDFCVLKSEEFSIPMVIAGNGKNLLTFCTNASLLGVPLTKVWESPFTDLGIVGKDKILKRIELYTKNQITIKVITDKMQKTFLFNPKNNYALENIEVRGREFKFIISSSFVDCEISKPTLTFTYV